jgi:Ser/Thr protein kinase RdoA (MazF antagonist)
MFPALRSIVDPVALAALAAREYGLDVTGCVLLRSLVNDVYRLETPAGPRVLKLYRAGHGSAGWEVALAAYVGAGVAQGVPLKDGRAAGLLPAAEGPRAFTAEAGRRVAGDDLERGICHGDVTLDNIHVAGDRIIFFDLDRAALGHRAADLSPVASTPQSPAFLAGYRTVRGFPAAAQAALPWLNILLRIDYLHFHLYAKPAMRGTESLTEGWVDENLTALRAAASRLS